MASKICRLQNKLIPNTQTDTYFSLNGINQILGKVLPLRKVRSKSSSIPFRLHTIERDVKAFYASRDDIGKTTFRTALYDSKLVKEDITSRYIKYSGQNISLVEIVE